METKNEMLSCPKCKSQNVSSKNGQFHCVDCGCQWQLTNEATATGKNLTIRNSTTEFLIFQAQSQANGVEVFYQNETLWLTQKAIAMLFDVDRTVVTKHLKNVFESGELLQDSVCAICTYCRRRENLYHKAMKQLKDIQDRKTIH